MKEKKTIERIYLENKEFFEVENNIRLQQHLRRYAAVRRFCFGTVLDFASGCGYGTYLISKNPDVTKVIGVDIDSEAIDWAKKEFSGPNIEFIETDAYNINQKIDTLISLETIEHIKDPQVYKDLVKRCDVKQIIVCFPDKKSTHFNKFHFHDYVVQDIIDMFPGYVAYNSFRDGDVQFLLFIKLPDNAPSHIFRNILDLT